MLTLWWSRLNRLFNIIWQHYAQNISCPRTINVRVFTFLITNSYKQIFKYCSNHLALSTNSAKAPNKNSWVVLKWNKWSYMDDTNNRHHINTHIHVVLAMVRETHFGEWDLMLILRIINTSKCTWCKGIFIFCPQSKQLFSTESVNIHNHSHMFDATVTMVTNQDQYTVPYSYDF